MMLPVLAEIAISALTALGSVGTVAAAVKKVWDIFAAERRLKAEISSSDAIALRHKYGDRLARKSELSDADKQTLLEELRAQMTTIVERAPTVTGKAETTILSGLQQSSDTGKNQYAEKLYSTVVDTEQAVVDTKEKEKQA